jgi:hypothetical protein
MKEGTLLMLDGERHMIKSRIFILTSLMVLSAFLPAPVVSGARGTQRPLQGTQVWDTQSPFVSEANLADRARWKAVSSLLVDNERYTFKGDAVVENQHVTAVFISVKGRVSVYSKADSNERMVELVPLELKGKPARITGCTLIRNTDDETALEVTFSGVGAGDKLSAVFSFGGKEIVAIEPARNMKGISLLSSIEYGVVPAFIGDDLVFDAREYPSLSTLHVPCDSLFLGLLKGHNDMLVVTWPEGKQKMRLVLDNVAGDRLIESADFDNDGKSIYLALLHAPGIWHKEELKPSYLEKDVVIDWARPFRAKWKTQLLEAGIRTTFRFRESKEEIWRAAIGYYTYPVWFEGEKAFYRLGKKIPPRGDSLIYYLEGTDASEWPASAVDILKQTLDKETCDRKLALRGRAKLDFVRPVSQIDPNDRTRHAARGSRPVATCPVTQSLTSIFKAGQEQDRRDDVEAGVEDMMYFVTQHRRRIERYMTFSRDMMVFLKQEEKSKPDLRSFIGEMEAVVHEIPQEYDRVKDNIKDLDYAAGLAQQTKALARERRSKNLEAFLDLGQKWRSMGGAQDDLIREFHTMTRKLFQKAGYGCAGLPDALEISQEIRRRCKECLSNPSTYEIWADY